MVQIPYTSFVVPVKQYLDRELQIRRIVTKKITFNPVQLVYGVFGEFQVKFVTSRIDLDISPLVPENIRREIKPGVGFDCRFCNKADIGIIPALNVPARCGQMSALSPKQTLG